MTPLVLDRELSIVQAESAHELLVAAGFILDLSQCFGTPRAIAWRLGGLNERRRKLALELLELVAEDSEAA